MINRHDIAAGIKKILYPSGEPYVFAGKTLKFKVGSRPIKRSYVSSANDMVRNDVLQINYFEEHFSPDDILWDIGSHHGVYSILSASKAARANQVFSFEPSPQARVRQIQNIRLNNLQDKITLTPVAVSNKEGTLKFSSGEGSATAHLVKDESEANTVAVQSTTINNLVERFATPTFVKIDTEGAEIDILSQADKLLNNKDVQFICELHPFAWKYFGVSYEQFKEILQRSNRKIRLLDDRKSESDLPYYGTVLF